MLQLTLQSPNGNSGKAEMFIDYQSECVGFTVVTADEKQFDFSIDKDEWEQFKAFIESSMKKNSDTD